VLLLPGLGAVTAGLVCHQDTGRRTAIVRQPARALAVA
jgi:hypothetical protein